MMVCVHTMRSSPRRSPSYSPYRRQEPIALMLMLAHCKFDNVEINK